MDRRLKRPVAIGAAALLAVGGAGAAVAATSGSNSSDAILNDAAKRLDVSPQKLSDALKGALSDRIDQAVKDGKLTQQQADRIKQRIQQGNGLPPFGPRFEMHMGLGGPRGDLKAAADYLGLSVDQLGAQLRNGKTLADVAKAQGKSVDGLKDAIVDAASRTPRFEHHGMRGWGPPPGGPGGPGPWGGPPPGP